MAGQELHPPQEFSDLEMATLARFDAAQARFPWAEEPLTPTGPIVHAHELVPQPSTETGTAAEWSTYYLARACAQERLATFLVPRGVGPDDELTDYLAALTQFVSDFSIAFLLRRVPDEVAQELMGWLDSGDVADEWTYQWLREAGVNPGHIRSALTRDEIRAERERRLTQLRASRTVHAAAAEQLAAAGHDVELTTDAQDGAR